MRTSESELEAGFELHGAVVLLNEYTRLHLLGRAHPEDYLHVEFDRLKSLKRIRKATENYQRALETYLRQ